MMGPEPVTPAQRELATLKDSVRETEIVGNLVAQTKTLDQARALLTFAAAVSDKSLRQTVALTAGRGRGKSAAMGLAIASAVGFGYVSLCESLNYPAQLISICLGIRISL